MNFATSTRRALAAALFVLAGFGHALALAEEALPDASTVMQRLIKRGEEMDRVGKVNEYIYRRHSINEELDASGNPSKTTDETYEVIPIQGVPFSRLIRIQNRELTDAETKAQDKKEQAFRQKLARKGGKAKVKGDEDWLDGSLIDRYEFKVERRDTAQNRPVLILSFHPKANRGVEKTVEDKVLGRLAGTLWVDEGEAEVAQLKVGLVEDLSLGWFGMVGSLSQFDLLLEKQRLPDGVWVDQKQTIVLRGRKVFSAMRHNILEEFSNFRKP